MVALRKDVKVGLIVGGITLAVVAVYVGLSALSSGPAPKDAAPVADITQPSPADAPTPAVAKNEPRPGTPNPAAPRELANAAPTTPVAQQPRPAGSDDVWSNAFTHGSVQPSVTVTPSLNNPSREPAAKPSDVINALQNPKPPTPAQNATSTASASDSRGSLAANSPTATLTRGNAATQPAAAAAPTVGGTSYVVKPGDTFSSIAAEHYGDANQFKAIIAANPTVDSARMKPGVALILPPRDAVAKPAAAILDPARQYVVKPGDSLESIASALYGERSKWQSIYDANKPAIGDSPARLKVGTVLTLPAAPTKK